MKKSIVILVALCFILAGMSAVYYYFEQKNKLKIAFLGDSITWFGWDLPYGYLHTFIKNLNNEGFEITPYPAGIKGETTKQMYNRINYDVLRHNPDIMFLMGGLNDIRVNSGVENFKNTVEQIVETAQNNKIKVILMTMTVYSEDKNAPKNLEVSKLNNVLRQIAQEKKLQIIDVNTPLWQEINKNKKHGCIVTVKDGVHLNEKGNEILAATVTEEFLKIHKPYRLLSEYKSSRK
ncbi:MAG: hypothetical protein K6C94_05225 [Candidatus Gastranaerophilales bacterium]|nr:hypothetical protein [Candidatus Gastranaerophilales bacterium]